MPSVAGFHTSGDVGRHVALEATTPMDRVGLGDDDSGFLPDGEGVQSGLMSVPICEPNNEQRQPGTNDDTRYIRTIRHPVIGFAGGVLAIV